MTREQLNVLMLPLLQMKMYPSRRGQMFKASYTRLNIFLEKVLIPLPKFLFFLFFFNYISLEKPTFNTQTLIVRFDIILQVETSS